MGPSWGRQDPHIGPMSFAIWGVAFNIKMPTYQHKNSHCQDKTILCPYYLPNEISCPGNKTYLYWIRVRDWIICMCWQDEAEPIEYSIGTSYFCVLMVCVHRIITYKLSGLSHGESTSHWHNTLVSIRRLGMMNSLQHGVCIYGLHTVLCRPICIII